MEEIIGRSSEIAIFKKLLNSKKAEFLAVYGRRRVGKTFLIKHAFKNYLVFKYSGAFEIENDVQLKKFYTEFLQQAKPKKKPTLPKNWFEAFFMLAQFVKTKKRNKRAVIFIDELPWMETPKSNMIKAFADLWNSHLVNQSNVILVICGSSSSWINKKIFKNRGALHNRVTKRINLQPFNLAETEAFCKHKNLKLTQYQIAKIYMAFGGIPFYLNELEKGKSHVQNIDKICFSKNGLLKTEYNELFFSLFKNAENHIKIIEALASKPQGLTKSDLSKITKLDFGGSLLRPLNELEECGFVHFQEPTFNKKRNGIYRLIDMYSLFYLKFIKKNKSNKSFKDIAKTNAYKVWCGYAFENICLLHSKQIKKAIGISGILSSVSSWKFFGDKNYDGTQIDLLIDRSDDIINLCEIKFWNAEYVLSKKYYEQNLRKKRWTFEAKAKTKKAIQTILITTFGAKKNEYYLEGISNEVILTDLFAKI